MTFLDLGFADQPHFLKEFKKLVSTTPMHYQDKVKHESYLKKIEYAWSKTVQIVQVTALIWCNSPLTLLTY